MNIEESVKELRGYLTWLEADGFSKLAKDSAIETLLTAYEKEKEKNKKLINRYVQDKVKIGKDIQTYINKDYVNQEYISKDKIKTKIEEIGEGTYDAKIVLQSLLEKEE